MADIAIYGDDILAIGAIHKDHAVNASNIVGVDHTTVLGAILEEAHDSTEPGSWKRTVVDALPNYSSDTHEKILQNYNYVESLTAQERYQMGNFEKLQNPVMLGRGDGYFKPHTAINLLNEYNSQYPDSDPLNLKRFNDDYASMTRELESRGSATTANFTALMVKKAMEWGAENVTNWDSWTHGEQDAFAVYFYNVGEEQADANRLNSLDDNGDYFPDIGNTDQSQEFLLNRGAISQVESCFGPEVPIDMWPLDPQFAPDPNNPHKQYDQDAVRDKIWKKPIELIRVGDYVVSHDKNGNIVPGYVPRIFQNDAKILLSFHGTRVTPGHVYYRPDSKKSYKYETLIDVLRDDGVIKHQDGTLIRAATNVPVDGPSDGFVQAVTQVRKADGTVIQNDAGRIRLGTRFLVGTGKERKSWAVADLIEAGGGVVGDDELIRVGGGEPMPFLWDFGDTLPKPEDFVLACSGTTLEEIYKAAEWESQGPRLPAPMVLDRGPVQPLSDAERSSMPRNEPLNVDGIRSGAVSEGLAEPLSLKHKQ